MFGDEKTEIGLNEVALGIAVPKRWMSVMASVIGLRNAELYAGTGKMMLMTDAKLGMIDVIVSSRDELLKRAETYIARVLVFPDSGRSATKLSTRSELSLLWQNEGKAEAAQGWKLLSMPGTINALKRTLERLAKNSQQSQKQTSKL